MILQVLQVTLVYKNKHIYPEGRFRGCAKLGACVSSCLYFLRTFIFLRALRAFIFYMS